MNSRDDRYCFLDLETTGFDSKEDSIIEISFILTDQNLKEIDRFDKVIIPCRSSLSPTVTRITGITQEEIDTNGVEWESIQETVQEMVGGTVIIGHNIDFDIRFLSENGITLDPNKRIDTHELSRIFLVQEESYALEVLSQKYGFLHADAHRAMSDVEASKDLFEMMLQKINNISPGLKKQFEEVFVVHPHWYAKNLLIASKASNVERFEKPLSERESGNLIDTSIFKELHSGVRITQSLKASTWTRSLCESFAKKGERVLLITPKIPYFEGVKTIPVPEIILDPQQLNLWGQKNRSNNEIAFLLKCIQRFFYGFKDVFAMDLYFKERDYWKEVSLKKDDDERFLSLLEDLRQEPVLCLSPDAYARFSAHSLLTERTLIVDEAELVAQGFVNAPVTTHRFLPYLDNDDTTVAAQFVVRGICQDVIEPLIGKKAGPFPERILLPKEESYQKIAEQLSEVLEDETLSHIKKILTEPSTDEERWLVYYPDSGDIHFSVWSRSKWENIKEAFIKQKSVLLYRHIPDPRKMFFQHFFNLSDMDLVEVPEVIKLPALVIPKNLESQKSEAYISYCENFVKAVIKDKVSKDHWFAAHVSSIETLRKVFDRVYPSYLDSPITIKGEKMAGGAGKLLSQLESVEQGMLFYQKISSPNLAHHPFKSLAMLKFPFDAGNPLYEALEIEMKQKGGSWWDFWTVPNLQANLSRSISWFPQAETFYFLDSRENSHWGKSILKGLFE